MYSCCMHEAEAAGYVAASKLARKREICQGQLRYSVPEAILLHPVMMHLDGSDPHENSLEVPEW